MVQYGKEWYSIVQKCSMMENVLETRIVRSFLVLRRMKCVCRACVDGKGTALFIAMQQ